MKKGRFKRSIHNIHLYVGLVIGLLFFIIALSGALYAWEAEISHRIYKQSVEARDNPFVPVSQLRAELVREFPEGDFRAVTFQGKSSAAKVLIYAPGTYYYAFMDPYTGKIQHLQNMKEGWLNYLKSLHRNLLLGDVGRAIVHWVTLLSFFMVLTGLILWWPHRKSRRKYHFTINLKSKPVKLNYDLHNVLGFYASWIGVFIILTGIFWGFEPIRNGLRVLTRENETKYDIPESNVVGSQSLNYDPNQKVDSLATAFLGQFPDKRVRISYPHKETDAIHLAVIHPQQVVYSTDYYHFDQYTGALLQGNFQNGIHSEASAFTTLNGLIYDIHLGNLGHFWGRLLVSLTALVLASLPITGFVIWLGKRKT
ncbi:PepSY-associated TM helix domain-containing protein [Ulvibacterium sp.]|uniref:PepSY-associated TM helix domain-containing protein n=1 Tax=Ulvibacterium sp. TaxID=2665914 RepID=UPI003BA8EAE7